MILFETKYWDKEKRKSFVKVICEDCNNERLIAFQDAETCFNKNKKNLCGKCSRTGSNNSFFNKQHSDKTKNLLSKLNIGKFIGEKNPMFGKFKELSSNYKEPHLRKTTLYKQIKYSTNYLKWRNLIFKRDFYTCTHCGDNKGGNLNVDHIKPFAVILKENKIGVEFIDRSNFEENFKKMCKKIDNCKELWDTNNGRTLCELCHKKTDTFGAKTKKLLKEIK